MSSAPAVMPATAATPTKWMHKQTGRVIEVRPRKKTRSDSRRVNEDGYRMMRVVGGKRWESCHIDYITREYRPIND